MNMAAASVMAGMEDCVIASGTEMMSFTNAYAAEKAAVGLPSSAMGGGHAPLDELHPMTNQGVAGDAIAAKEGIPRAALDALALESQRR